MASRRPSICLFCQARQSSIGRRKATNTARRRLQTATIARPEDDGFLLHGGQQDSKKEDVLPAKRFSDNATLQVQGHNQQTSEYQQAVLEFDAFRQRRDVRLQALRKMRNPWGPWNPTNEPFNGHRSSTKSLPVPPEAAGAPIPLPVFRRSVRTAEGYKAIRQTIRAQLLRCEEPRDILRITAVVMQTRVVAKNFAVLVEPIIRAMYRCRKNASDPEILRTIKVLAKRFDLAGLEYDRHLLFTGLKFGARARSLSAMKWFLQRIKQERHGMTSNIFRSVIAKFSIGHRGLGEIRNGRWRREELLQVLNGFDDCSHLPPERQFHLGSFLVRNDWQYLHGWVAALARCRDADSVWREWELWQTSPVRRRPRGLNGIDRRMTTKLRGDYWFVEQMAYTRDWRRAWRLLEETGLDFRTLKPRVRSALLEGIEHATRDVPGLQDALLWKYDLELSKIETALGVVWSSDTESHTLIPGRTQEESLERLAANDFGAEEDYGFPYEDDPDVADGAIVESRERALHDAQEEDVGMDRSRDGDGSAEGISAGKLGQRSRKTMKRRRTEQGSTGDQSLGGAYQ